MPMCYIDHKQNALKTVPIQMKIQKNLTKTYLQNETNFEKKFFFDANPCNLVGGNNPFFNPRCTAKAQIKKLKT